MLPPSLKPGDTIGFFSPSSPATHYAPKRTERAVQYLQQAGYRVKPGKLTGESDHYRSGTIQARADELNSLIRDPEVRCIMSTIGGANSNALLPYLDYDAIKNDPKLFVGYSDATAILLAIYAKTNLVTFYGPALTASLGEMAPLVHQTFESFREVTQFSDGRLALPVPEFWSEEFIDWETQDRAKALNHNDVRFYGTGRITGRLMGGNLNTMSAIWGSPYMPSIQNGDVLLIEDSLKDIATVERLFSFLHINGIFENVSAILLGKHELFNDGGTGRKPMDVLTEVLGAQSLPIVDGFDACHTHPMTTVPIGGTIEIDLDNKRLELSKPCTVG